MVIQDIFPFGLSSAPYIFTKLLKPLETHWRAQGIPIAIFFDDGVGAGSSLEAAKFNSFLVRSDLSRCGFEINHGKSNWEPMNKFSWIGYNIDTHRGFIFANDSRIEKLCSDLNDLCSCQGNCICRWSNYFNDSQLRECFPNYDKISASHYQFSPFLEFCCFRV